MHDEDGEQEQDFLNEGDPVELEIDGVLDLHTFQPRDVSELVGDYLNLCAEKGILDMRIIHGKGRGVLRDRVRSILKRHPLVESFSSPSRSRKLGRYHRALEGPTGGEGRGQDFPGKLL